MKNEDIQLSHCAAPARTLAAKARAILTEMGRPEDGRPVPAITGAQPRECYFEAIAVWYKASRLAAEVGVEVLQLLPRAPDLRAVRPEDVLQIIDAARVQIDAARQRLGCPEQPPEPTSEPAGAPEDVLVTLIKLNRNMARVHQHPFTPTEVYRPLALASAYATCLGAPTELAPFEPRVPPPLAHARISACLARTAELVKARGGTPLAVRSGQVDMLPSDNYDLVSLLLGEVAYLHALTPGAAPLHPFAPEPRGYYLPAHVVQLANTLLAQLTALK